MAVLNDIAGALGTFRIGEQVSAAGQPIQLTLQGSKNIPAAAAILSGTAPFPQSQSDVTSLTFKASTGASVPLGNPSDKVSFTSRDSAGYVLKVYPDGASVAKAAGKGANITGQNGERFLMLDLFYDASASAKGSIALDAGATAIFGADAKRHRGWKVVHRFGNVPAAKAVADTIGAWILPRQIDSPERLSPGTWIVSQVDGSLSMNAGVEAGFDFSWIRELPGGRLLGDLGLKLNAASAEVKLSAGGTCTLVIGRESEAPVLRLSLYKSDTDTLGFNASLGIPSIANMRPGDFAAAVLGLHPAQLVADLRKIAPGFQDFYAAWDKLGAKSSSTLLSLITERQPDEMRQFTALLDEIAAVATNPLKITTILEREIADPAFFKTPLGQLLSSQTRGLVQALQNLTAVREIGKFTEAARDLSKGKFPPLVVAAMNKFPSYSELDDWLRERLAGILDKTADRYTKSDHAALERLYAKLLDKSRAFAAEGVKAARKNLEARFVAECQSTQTGTALIDVEFDFKANPGLLPLFQEAIGGNFTRILTDRFPGVRLRKGVLTHGVERQVHTALTLPFYDTKSSVVMSSLAKMTASAEDGRLSVYELKASDDWQTQTRSDFARDSKLCVAAALSNRLDGVRTYGTSNATVGYSLTAGVRGLSAATLNRYFEPLTAEYFPNVTEVAASLFPDADLIGDTRVSLDVTLPGTVLDEWFAAPADPGDPVYFRFSRLMQAKLKQLICDVYFGDPTRYVTLGVAAPVLVWASIPPMNSFDGKRIQWDASDPESYGRVVSDLRTREALRDRCAVIAPMLAASPATKKSAKFYDVGSPKTAPAALGGLLSAALRKPSMNWTAPPILGAMVAFEQAVIRAAVRAATEAARFVEDAGARPADAIRHLSKFGEEVVETFHEHLRKAVALPAEMMVPLGAALFAETSRALRVVRTGDDDGCKPTAYFALTVLKPGTKLSAEQLRKGDFRPDLVAAERRIAG